MKRIFTLMFLLVALVTSLAQSVSTQENMNSGTSTNISASEYLVTDVVTWCDASSSNTADDWISNVTVTPTGSTQMSNDSGSNTYTDYSGDADKLVVLAPNSTGNTISISKDWGSTQWSLATTVWIDFNRDGVFEDSEKIMNDPSSTVTPVTATFDVPATAYVGNETTRMRVIVKEFGPAPVCGTFTWGEVEDYAVQFLPPPPCTTNPPADLTISNITATTADASWAAYTGSVYHIRYREVGTANWIEANDLTQSTYGITGLTESTTYEVQVANTCNGVMGAYSASVEFTTTAVTWCQPGNTPSSNSEFISNVTVNPVGNGVAPMVNDSGPDGYTDYFADADKLVTLEAGTQGNEIIVSKDCGNWNESVNVWIDFNRNGVFESSEKVMETPYNSNTPVSGLFDVPQNAYSGPLKTKMRVMMKWGSGTNFPDPCDGFSFGEIEDYAVEIKPSIPCDMNPPQNVNIINITDTTAEISWTEDPGGATYILKYRPVGDPTWTEVALTVTNYAFTALAPLTEYEVEVVPVCNDDQNQPVQGTPAQTTFETKCDPTPPSGLQVTQITATSAEVSWNPAPNIGNAAVYKLLYRETGVANWTEVDINVPTTTHTLTGLTPYTNYEVKVATQCSGAINPYTNNVVFKTLPTCEMAPTGLTVTNISITQAQVDWDEYEGATYVIRWRKVGNNPWNTADVNTNHYIIQGLQEITQYEVQVAKFCNGAVQEYTEPYLFTTPSIEPCTVRTLADSNEYISNVTVLPYEKPDLEMDNDSNNSTYTSYVFHPDKIVILVKGTEKNKISVSKKWDGDKHNEGVIAWIDFNRDGVFADNEMILQSAPSKVTPITGTFTVPMDAFVSLLDGKYLVMRVAIARDKMPEPCGIGQYGEVEDYKVIVSQALLDNLVDEDEISLYPNPARDEINFTNIADGHRYEIYTTAGRLVKRGIILGSKVNVRSLIKGVYIVSIKTDVDKSTEIKFIKE